MASTESLQSYLDGAQVAPEVFALRPDYRALLIAIDGITPSPGDETSEAMLKQAEASAKAELAKRPVTEIPHVASWRGKSSREQQCASFGYDYGIVMYSSSSILAYKPALEAWHAYYIRAYIYPRSTVEHLILTNWAQAYKAFGAKPKKDRNSLEALTRRVEGTGLPRVNRLTDIYNAISVQRQIPLGGEDLQKYQGPPRCIRATGDEPFETKAGIEHPDKGEVVWCDDAGVTCRKWNWRQGPRTALTDDTKSVLFICDALDALSDEQLVAVGDELIEALRKGSPDLKLARRLIRKEENGGTA